MLSICWWYKVAISKSMRNQRIVYNGQKRIHAFKIKNVALPNGLIASLHGPYKGLKHDVGMLLESGLLATLQRSAWLNKYLFCRYGDSAYPINVHLQRPFPNYGIIYVNIVGHVQTLIVKDFNKVMCKVRIEVAYATSV